MSITSSFGTTLSTSITGNLSVPSGNFSVSGVASITGSLSVIGGASITSSLSVSGGAAITGSLSVSGGASSNFIDVDSTGLNTRARALALLYTPQNTSWTPNTDPQDGSRGLGLYTNVNTRPVVLTLRNLGQPTTQIWDIINEGSGNTRLLFQSFNNGSINSPLTLDGTLQRVGINNVSPSYSFHTFGSRIEIENPSGEARFGCYNGGGVAEWVWGQGSGSDSNFVFNKKVSGSETNIFYIETGSPPNVHYQVPLSIAPSVTPNTFPLRVVGNSFSYAAGATYYIQGNSNSIAGPSTAFTGPFSAFFGDRIIASEVWTPSDIRLKKNIYNLDLDNCYRFLTSIEPKSFTWKSEDAARINYGYIAQDALKKGFENLVTAIPSEEIEAYEDGEITCVAGVKFIFNYQDVIPILHKVILDLKEKQSIHQEEIKLLQDQLKTLMK